MKTQELFELRYSKKKKVITHYKWDPVTKKGEHHPDGLEVEVDTFNPARFHPNKRGGLGNIHGTTGDWLNLMGATKADILPGRKLAMESPEYQRLLKLGFDDISTLGEVKNGTITFKGKVKQAPWPGAPVDWRSLIRRIHVNGNIRTHGGDNTHHAGRGATFAPWTVESHPDSTPAERIAGSMRQSMKRLSDLYTKPMFAAVMDKLSPR